jgi:hypothetical protein
MIGGGVLIGIGFIFCKTGHRLEQFAYSWLLGFMFFLSLCAGGLFLVLVHHLFDAVGRCQFVDFVNIWPLCFRGWLCCLCQLRF